MLDLIKKIVGTKNDREVKRIRPYVLKINELEAEYQKLSDAELRDKTEQFKKRVREATDPLRSTFEEVQKEALAADTEEREEQKAGLRNQIRNCAKRKRRFLKNLYPKPSRLSAKAHGVLSDSDILTFN